MTRPGRRTAPTSAAREPDQWVLEHQFALRRAGSCNRGRTARTAVSRRPRARDCSSSTSTITAAPAVNAHTNAITTPTTRSTPKLRIHRYGREPSTSIAGGRAGCRDRRHARATARRSRARDDRAVTQRPARGPPARDWNWIAQSTASPTRHGRGPRSTPSSTMLPRATARRTWRSAAASNADRQRQQTRPPEDQPRRAAAITQAARRSPASSIERLIEWFRSGDDHRLAGHDEALAVLKPPLGHRGRLADRADRARPVCDSRSWPGLSSAPTRVPSRDSER